MKLRYRGVSQQTIIVFVQYKHWAIKNAIDLFVIFLIDLLIFETNFYPSKVENYFKVQNQKHTVFN
jgi:hypothetical protein